MRGKDKLTVAQWENAGKGSGSVTAANGDLAGLSYIFLADTPFERCFFIV